MRRAGVVVGAFGVLVLGACSSEETPDLVGQASPTPVAEQSPVVEPKEPVTASFGKTLSVTFTDSGGRKGTLKVKVEEPRQEGRTVRVPVSITKGDGAPYYVSWGEVTVLTADNAKYATTAPPGVRLFTNEKTTQTLTFELPSSARIVKVAFDPNYDSTFAAAVWN